MFVPVYKIKNNGVPILSKQEIDTIAEKLILDFNPTAMKTPMEIDIDDFSQNYLGLKQDFQYLSHNGIYLGMMVFNDTNKVVVYTPETNTAEYIDVKAGTIIIDNSLLEVDQEHRYRYTMGHECGHDIFHTVYFSYDPNQISLFNNELEPMIQCRALPTNGQFKPVSEWDDKDSMEWQANYLSSSILMPRAMVFKLIDSLPTQTGILKIASYVQAVKDTFNVSWQAAGNRLRCLNIITEDIPAQATITSFGVDLH